MRGGAHKIYEGDRDPARLVLLEFPSQEARESDQFVAAFEPEHPGRDA
ncbi:DUF1330 domain-containing protein [Pseudonocardia bannensis]|uniref:DUF1330 domain-containing protein n=1 Tax=Pseudonocardia bannensis TaxID=630973 RepID=A0A848DGA8_9PSEU|nr:DUF1330 domain-containing protein [Pseudonocardia bannensis]